MQCQIKKWSMRVSTTLIVALCVGDLDISSGGAASPAAAADSGFDDLFGGSAPPPVAAKAAPALPTVLTAGASTAMNELN